MSKPRATAAMIYANRRANLGCIWVHCSKVLESLFSHDVVFLVPNPGSWPSVESTLGRDFESGNN